MRCADTEPPPLSEVREKLLYDSFKTLVLPILDLYGGEKRETALREVLLRFKPFFGVTELFKLIID